VRLASERMEIVMAAPLSAWRTWVVPDAAAGSSVPQSRDPSVSVACTSGPVWTVGGANHSSPTVTTNAPSAPAAARTPFLRYPT
jgi:hypothetical protein